MHPIQTQFSSVDPIGSPRQKQTGSSPSVQQDKSALFQNYLNQAVQKEQPDVRFSKHASDRLKSRSIEISGGQLERLNSGVQKAREKNIKESLVLIDNLKFIVNVSSNTVVTAVNDADGTNQIFTNIDGAVII